MFIGDFHIHTTFSDGRLSIEEVIDLYGSWGVKAIAITDHLCDEKSFLGRAAKVLNRTLCKSTFSTYLQQVKKQAKRAMDKYGMLVIPGVEVTLNSFSYHDSAHFLVLGIDKPIEFKSDVESTLKSIKDKGYFTVAAHPVSTRVSEHQTFYLWQNKEYLKDYFDAWEVASGRFIFEEVAMSGLPLIANSDFHRKSQFESWKTVFSCEFKQQAIFEAIKNQNVDFKYYSMNLQTITPSIKGAAMERPYVESITNSV